MRLSRKMKIKTSGWAFTNGAGVISKKLGLTDSDDASIG